MLIAASCPSNKDAAVTNRNGGCEVLPDVSGAPGRSLAAVLMASIPPKETRKKTPKKSAFSSKNQ
jgi:hypothetical protein